MISEVNKCYLISSRKHVNNLSDWPWTNQEKFYKFKVEKADNDDGKCYIANENNKTVGLIMECIFTYDECDYFVYKCPKSGENSYR